MPESVVPTAPPAYEDLPILPSAPPCSSPSIPTGPPPDFSTNDDENVLNSTSAAPHLPSFPRFHSFRAENDRETQPPPYQFVELSVTQLDETEDARRIESEINMGVDGLMRRSEERDRLDDARRMRINQRCTGVVSRTAHTSTAHCHQHESCQENVEGNEACCWVAGCLLCGAVGCFVMGFCMIRRGITGGKKPHQQDRSYRNMCILFGLIFMFIFPACVITSIVLFFQNNPNFFDSDFFHPSGNGYTESPWDSN